MNLSKFSVLRLYEWLRVKAGERWITFSSVSFAEVLRALKLPRFPAVLDVGAGGILGSNTTAHLLKMRGAVIDAIEIDSTRAIALETEFAGRIGVIAGDFLEHQFDRLYDLIVLDLDAQLIPALYEEWLPGRVKQLLKPGGSVIVLCFGYAPEAPTESYGLNEQVQATALGFLKRYFGSTVLTPEIVQKAIDEQGDYRFVAMKGKLGNPPPEPIVWIALKRVE